MFEVIVGKEGLGHSWQAAFPETTECVHCSSVSRIGFVAFEEVSRSKSLDKQRFVSNLHPNDPDGEGCWLHDCCAVAVYFCKECLNPTVLYNQA